MKQKAAKKDYREKRIPQMGKEEIKEKKKKTGNHESTVTTTTRLMDRQIDR